MLLFTGTASDDWYFLFHQLTKKSYQFKSFLVNTSLLLFYHSQIQKHVSHSSCRVSFPMARHIQESLLCKKKKKLINWTSLHLICYNHYWPLLAKYHFLQVHWYIIFIFNLIFVGKKVGLRPVAIFFPVWSKK